MSLVDCGSVRFRVISSAVEVVDLRGAGKRGKTCASLSVYDLDRRPHERQRILAEVVPAAQALADDGAGFDVVAAGLRCAALAVGAPTQERTRRGVDIAPAGFPTVVVATHRFAFEVSYDGFGAHDKEDRNNEPTIIPPMRARATAVKAAQRFVADPANVERIRSMSFSELLDALKGAGVRYHYFCAMD